MPQSTTRIFPSSYVSSSGASSTGDRFLVTGLAGEVNVHVSIVSPAQQSHSEAQDHSDRRGDAHCLLVDAFMQYYQAAGFSREVSKLAAAPTCRRPSTNRMYDDRWLRFTNWATGRGFNPLGPTAAQIAAFLYELFDTHGVSLQTIKGYRFCLASVLSCTGRAAEVSDMTMSMELQRPRLTPVLPQSDLGIVLEALSKPPYEPLREAFLKHLNLKTVFLLAMASGGRCSELQALVFDPQYIQFNPKGAGVTLYFTPKFMRKTQRPNQVNYPWYIPAVPTGRPEFGAPNCPLRAPKYYHRYMCEHPELRKGRRRLFVPLFIPFKELSAASISRWIFYHHSGFSCLYPGK